MNPDREKRVLHALQALDREADDARRMVEDQAGSLLDFCHRLIAVVRVALEEKAGHLPDTGWRAIVITILVKVVSSIRAAHTLATSAHVPDARIVVRSALESFITAAFIAKEDSDLRALRWAQHSEINKARLLRKYPELSPSVEHRASRDEVLTRAQELERFYPNKGFWASGLGKGSIRDLAEDVEMAWHYDMVYWSGSQATHGSAIAVGSFLFVDSDGNTQYRIGLSAEHLRGEMAVCCELLVRGLALLNEVCGLAIDEVFDDLIGEYKAAFGDDPPSPRP